MSFRVNIDQVQKQIAEIKASIEDLNSQINALTQLREEIESFWKGDTASEFVLQIENLMADLQKTKAKMEELVQTIENTVTRIANEDQVLEDLMEGIGNIFFP